MSPKTRRGPTVTMTIEEATRLTLQPPITPTPLVAIDPGKRHAGVALFVASRLEASWRIATRTPATLPGAIIAAVRQKCPGIAARWVCETPQSYAGHRGREKDLKALRALLERLRSLSLGEGVCTSWVEVTPSEWKGNVPKAVHHRRVEASLDVLELRAWCRDTDSRDAVALGLWRLGRLGRGGVRLTEEGSNA